MPKQKTMIDAYGQLNYVCPTCKEPVAGHVAWYDPEDGTQRHHKCLSILRKTEIEVAHLFEELFGISVYLDVKVV